jgi:hypothetical protein
MPATNSGEEVRERSRHAQDSHPGICVLVVSGIKVETTEDGRGCSGGEDRILLAWDTAMAR